LLRTRILTGVVLGVVVVASVLALGTTPASLVFAAFWLVGAGEWARIAGLGRAGRLAFSAAFAIFALAVLAVGLPAAAIAGILWLAVACWLAAFVFVLRYPAPLAQLPIVVAGLVVLPAAWLAVHALHGAAPEGPGLILAGLVIVWSADIGAYFVGRGLGRTPLAPRVSPKKTWEGVFGGVALASIAGALAAGLLGQPLAVFASLAAGVALISVVGDLGISLLKRRAGLKDSGVLLPGHGGVLDRFDGVTAALPFFVLGLQFAHVLD
jgi:phosphatidate cytidylyltransferase